MTLTNKEMDEALERVAEADAFAQAHASDNSASYVGYRYAEMHGRGGYPVRIREGALDPMPAALYPASARSEARGKFDWRSAGRQGGIIALLRDGMTGATGEYLIASNGLNGVHVVGRA
jgi:hypothetical protein